MDNLGELYYECGIKYFEAERYKEAVSNWIQAYDLDYEKESIIENIYNCFILPNEQEFRKNYEQNREGFTEVPFEACTLDFIPLSEDEFCIFDREEKTFQGVIALEENPLQGDKIEFNDILYTDTWDIREMTADMKEYERDVVYVLVNELEPKFVSFLKLPRFRELYLKNVILFRNERIMHDFFEEYEEFYLPKQIVTADGKKYWDLIHNFHEKRIHHTDAERKNIFLSICIPSYNRGEIALENVRHLLSCPYDSEIEIVVSNNGSTKGVEAYEEIKNIKDSRIQYHEFPENQGYAANILKVCSMAKGRFAMLVSDEDLMILDHFGKYLSAIKANQDCGILFAGRGDLGLRWDPEEDNTVSIIEKGIWAIETAAMWTYVTGFTYNMRLCQKLGALEKLEQLRCGKAIDWRNEEMMLDRTSERNLCVEIYTNNCLAMMLCRYADFAHFKLDMFDVKKNNTTFKGCFDIGSRPECRLEKQNSRMDFVHQVLNLNKGDFIRLFLYECKRTHFLINLSFNAYPEDMLKLGSEWEIQACVYKDQKEYLDSFPIPLTEEEYAIIQGKIARTEE